MLGEFLKLTFVENTHDKKTKSEIVGHGEKVFLVVFKTIEEKKVKYNWKLISNY